MLIYWMIVKSIKTLTLNKSLQTLQEVRHLQKIIYILDSFLHSWQRKCGVW